ncbi:hypothetical protein [Sphingosinithalassobacter portus]|uniref:hypothetical protein n=1 Tax=Stakelama portus TaxID=2676234 RepID=UPI000D6E67BD|nr:hypothetical protein [Sphingosinithalassobacter portus]
MKRKMHLTAKVPNAGAHRLAWWLGAQGDGAFDALASNAMIDTAMIDRIIAGQLLPGHEIGLAVMQATDGAVMPRDFYRASDRGWFERPAAREVDRMAA